MYIPFVLLGGVVQPVTESVTHLELDALWANWRSGDRRARDQLIVFYWPFARRIARFVGQTVPSSVREDLEGFAAIGLIDAIDKFRPELGYRFETYGTIRIRGAISDGLRVLDWLPRDAAHRASGRIRFIDLVDFQTEQSASGKNLGETIADSGESPLELVIDNEDLMEVDQVVDSLPERERKVVIDRYYKNRLLRQTSDDFNLTESRICQLHRRALRLLDEKLTKLRSA